MSDNVEYPPADRVHHREDVSQMTIASAMLVDGFRILADSLSDEDITPAAIRAQLVLAHAALLELGLNAATLLGEIPGVTDEESASSL